MQHFTKISLIYYACYSIIDIAGLKLTDVSIPASIDIEAKYAQLSCKFEITDGKLYSVKWYKDEHEFFRYMPDSHPQKLTFPVVGVELDIGRSNKTTITLNHLNFDSSGKYRCEVSKDGPNFQTVGTIRDMTVVALPKEPPFISGVQPRYSNEDVLLGNCTSGPSKPAPNLTWYINNKTAEDRQLFRYNATPTHDQLSYASLGIRLFITNDLFANGSLLLKCKSEIYNFKALERSILVSRDNPAKDGIQAQKRNNNSSSQQQAERLNALMATISLYCLYFVYQ